MTTIEQTDTAIQTTHRTVDYKLEVAILPVSDVDRAKQFYAVARLARGRRLPDPRGLPRRCSSRRPARRRRSSSATGVTAAAPGSARHLLAVSDIEAARADLVARGVDVSDVFHGASGFDPPHRRATSAGPDPERTSYTSCATFSDPDGNTWLLQELTTRLPGR